MIKTIIDSYTYSSQRTLNNKSPNQFFEDNDEHMVNLVIYGSVHIQQIYKSVTFDTGQSEGQTMR
jgi:hypothetical protein